MSGRRTIDYSAWQGFLLFLYVASGTLQPILIEVLTYNGACEKSTFLFILPTYVGMSMSLLSNMDALKHGKIRWFKMILLAIIELCSAALCFTGLVCAGSAVFTVIYSSVTVYTALFSRIFFGRELHHMQWGGVFMVMLGLTSSSIGASFGGAEGEEDVGIGIAMIIIGSMFHSLVYILSESILKSEDPIAPEFLGSFMGCVGVFVFGLWQVFYTFPRFQDLILDEIDAHDGNFNVILSTYAILVIVNFIHGVCFYHLIKSVGSTTTGILKGVQSVMVFVISHFAFCAFQRSQCFTTSKGASLVVVVCGVSCYSIFKLDIPVTISTVKDQQNQNYSQNSSLLESSMIMPTDTENALQYNSINSPYKVDNHNVSSNTSNSNSNINMNIIPKMNSNINMNSNIDMNSRWSSSVTAMNNGSKNPDSNLDSMPHTHTQNQTQNQSQNQNQNQNQKPDYSSRINRRYHAIRNSEEFKSKVREQKNAVGSFDIGL